MNQNPTAIRPIIFTAAIALTGSVPIGIGAFGFL
jgi:hypothetical protein